ncbi:integrase core domain-containing protein [Leptospira santarosai]
MRPSDWRNFYNSERPHSSLGGAAGAFKTYCLRGF